MAGLVVGFSLAALTFLTYLPSMSNGYIWDDDDYVIQNSNLRSLDGLQRIWLEPGATRQYYPLVHSTFWIEYQMWALRPIGYHVTNVLLHAMAAVLIWRVLLRLELGKAVSWCAAAIFAVHPVHVESVAWITERKNVLMATLVIGSLLAYTRFDPMLAASSIQSSVAGRSQRQNWLAYAISLVLFVAAMFSKTVAAPLPIVIAVLYWWKRGGVSWRAIVPLAGFVFVAVPMGLMTIHMERRSVGATGPDFAFTLVERCLIAGRAAWFYAWKLLAPYELMFIYPRWQIDATQAWQYVFPVGVVVVIALCWVMRARWGRGPFCAVILFLLLLAPALGFVSVYPMLYSFVADHFQYLASIALIVGGVAGVDRLLRRCGDLQTRKRAGVILMSVTLILLGTKSVAQSANYYSAETLWRETLKLNSDSFMVHNNLGQELAKRGELVEAVRHFERARELKPDHAPIFNNLGFAASLRGDWASAEVMFQEAIRLQPSYSRAMINLAEIRARGGHWADAADLYRRAIVAGGPSAPLLIMYGLALAKSGRVEESIGQFESAIALDPSSIEAYVQLGTASAVLGRLADAEKSFRTAARLSPGDAVHWSNLGRAVAAQGRTREAIEHFQHALKLQPASADTFNDLGMALAQEGRMLEAVASFRQAVRLRPDFAQARENLEHATKLGY